MPSPCVVLVVDDNSRDSEAMREAMDWVGFDGAVVTVENAPQAFAYLSRRAPFANVPRPHLIMLDLSMPILTGWDVLRELKARPEWSSIPVIIFSSSRSPSDVAKAETMGARRFVSKPVTWDGYVEVARDVQQACCDAA